MYVLKFPNSSILVEKKEFSFNTLQYLASNAERDRRVPTPRVCGVLLPYVWQGHGASQRVAGI